ncbi:MAG TPA: hypothetical protein PLD84_07550 [Chitinophagales bacterium]|nr:hypothetical protein [Chitinophagales bacterium]
MQKGIILFDVKDFLYQGMDKNNPDIELINRKQMETLNMINGKFILERERRLSSNTPIPVVELFLPTGDGYYLLCSPELKDILDISHCLMAILFSGGIKAYCVAHIGDVLILTDLSGRQNATGFELGYASRLQNISKETTSLTISKNILNIWKENEYFELVDSWKSAIAKDQVEYQWKQAMPKNFESACLKFSQSPEN